MKDGVLEVKVHQVVPTNNGCAVFIGNQQKVFIIYVDQSVGMTIHMLMRGIKRERPLTHDLIGNIFAGLGVRVERVVVNDLKHDERGGTYYARLILCAENTHHLEPTRQRTDELTVVRRFSFVDRRDRSVCSHEQSNRASRCG